MRLEAFMGKRRRRKFTGEFKKEAVRLFREGERSIGQVAKELDLTESTVPSIYPSARPELDRSPVCRDHACMISSFVRTQPLARPQTQTLRACYILIFTIHCQCCYPLLVARLYEDGNKSKGTRV